MLSIDFASLREIRSMRASVLAGSMLCHALLLLALMHAGRPAVEAPPRTIEIQMIAPPPPPPVPVPPPKPVPRAVAKPAPKLPAAAPPRPAIQPRRAAPQPTPVQPAPFAPAQPTQTAGPPSTAVPVAAAVPAATAPSVPDTEVSARPIAGKPLVYPPRMRDQEHEGSVDFDCAIEADGSTSDCHLVSVEGGDDFVESARNYLQAARYRPATHNGVSVRQAHHKIHVEFRLD
ncbi:energy transducer TonB [Paraburkholderia pallida]|nr:energy transducer TonB [Paraburkholderia pallida]